MAKNAGKSVLRDALEDALTKELKRVSGGRDPDTDKPFTLTDKAKVWDRVLKLEGIKAKLNEGEWGKGFADGDDGDDA